MMIVEKHQPDVVSFDDMPPEAAAMILALYSRDPRSVRVHRERVEKVGPDKFMSQYYVGYGHKSIGDCGSTTICAEFVSMLCAKAIQHNPLYNGQEASTRYLDMSEMPVLNPTGTSSGEKIQQTWMNLYVRVLAELVPYLTEKYPKLPNEDQKIYEKAVKAKAFDIARSLLPAGCTTFVGWHTNLRQAWDHVHKLLFHPLLEVREGAKEILRNLRENYPSSFNWKSYQKQDAYLEACSKQTYINSTHPTEFSQVNNLAQGPWPEELRELLRTRPEKTELPDIFNHFGQVGFEFLLDFGSFRDLQRHRSCTQSMPLLTTRYGIEKWYLNSLPEQLREEVLATCKEQEAEIEKIEDPIIRQYYIAMGYRVTCVLTAGLPSAVYIVELRSGQTVHPTLRVIAQRMGRSLQQMVPKLVLHVDYSEDEWTTARGKHDIVKKEE